jgi:hypothetical protein
MLITVEHDCEDDIGKYDFLVVSLVEFVSSSKLTGQERKFLLSLISIKRNGGNPFHRSSLHEIKESFNFARPSQRIYRLKDSLRKKGYLNLNLSDFSEDLAVLMDSENLDLNISIKKQSNGKMG